MCHDYAHCLDYKKGKCPNDCFRAQLVEDLHQKRGEYGLMPYSWSHLRRTSLCCLNDENKEED